MHDALCLRHTPRILRSLRHESTVNHVSFYIFISFALVWEIHFPVKQTFLLYFGHICILYFCIFVLAIHFPAEQLLFAQTAIAQNVYVPASVSAERVIQI